jgi:aspartyl-tRNA(Asn)/glutamyl-tRNA(Gln) amidotransferase subunit A
VALINIHESTRREFAVSFAARCSRAQNPEDLAALSLTEVAARIRSQAQTSTQLVKAYLERIEVYNPKLTAFITVLRTQALAQARELDMTPAGGKWRGPLHGIPIALKDNIDTAGVRTTAASALFDDRVPDEDAETPRRLSCSDW